MSKTMEKTATKSQVFIITGMHRSGTSLTASLLQKLGVHIGKQLVGPEYGNVRGHFEDVDFVDFHKAVLRSQKVDDLGSNLPEKNDLRITKSFASKAKNLIKHNSNLELWGWKDPRTTLFLDFWQGLLPQANYIFVYRSPWEVVDSLYRRATDEILLEEPELAVKMWLSYNREILKFYEKYPDRCLLASVYHIGKNPEKFVNKINEKFHVNLPAPPVNNFESELLIQDILQSHRPSLITQHFPEAIEIYQQLINLGIDQDSQITDLQNFVEASSPYWQFEDWVNIRSLEKQAKLLKIDLEKWQEFFQEAQEKAIALESQLGETELVLDGKDVKLEESQNKIVQLETKLGISQSQLDGIKGKLGESQRKILHLETQLGQTQSRLDGSDHRFQEALSKLVKLETKLGQTQWQLDSAQELLQSSQTKLLNLETTLGDTQFRLDGSENKLQESQQRVEILENDLGKAQFLLAGAQAQVEDSQAKIAELENVLGQTQYQLNSTQVKLNESQIKISELENTLGQTQANLGKTQDNLNQTELALSRTQSDLYFTQGLLVETQTVLTQTEIMLGDTQGQLQSQRQETDSLRSEILAMRASPFWRLRNVLLGVRRRLKFGPSLVYSLEKPTSWDISNAQLDVAGWCFSDRNVVLKNIRARVGEQVFPGSYGIERLDVGVKHENRPQAKNSGFQIHLDLSAGKHTLLIEAEDTKGKWHKVVATDLTVSTVQGSIDVPVEFQQREGIILLAGWCCHPEQKITNLVLRCGDQEVNCAYGLRRKDVGEVFPQWVGSGESGFEATLEVGPGDWPLVLEAHLANGEIVGFPCPKVLHVKRYSWQDKIQENWQRVAKLQSAIKKQAAERKVRLGRVLPMPWEIPSIIRKIKELYRQQQPTTGEILPPMGFQLMEPVNPYDVWLQMNQWGDRDRQHLINRLSQYKKEQLPKISVIMPVYNPPVEFLRQAIQSVLNQAYENWEMCIADDCSTLPEVRETLLALEKTDPRIQVVFRAENGNISAATNTAASLATGDYLLFLDNDDELTVNALGEVALYIVEHPQADFIYSDDDKIDTDGKRFDPQFKPDWSPELLLSYMYLGHVCVVKRTIFEKIGGLRIGVEGSQDYDFALRATEIARSVGHIPLVLYHWRTTPGSTAISGGQKPESFMAGKQAVQDAFDRRQVNASVIQSDWAIAENLGIFQPKFPDQGPLVTIIIPTKNQYDLLKGCLESIKQTSYENYQVLVIDNESDDPQTLEYLAKMQAEADQPPYVKVLKISNEGKKFNFARINNLAVAEATGEYLLFLNNDTEILTPTWLSQMVGYAQLPGVGAVGARLIYPDQRIQHAGIIHGLHHGLAGHAFKLLHRDNRGYLSQASVSRNYSAVTAAAMLTPRQLFLDLGGFDQENFGVAYNDPDYGYRLLGQGYRSVFCPMAELLHREGTTRGFVDNPKEEANFRRKYANFIDPFYNPHLSLADELFKIQPRHYFLGESKKPLKILMCSNALDLTGGPLHQYEIAVELQKQGVIQPIIFCVNDGLLRQKYEQLGIEVVIKNHPLEHIYTRDDYDQALAHFAEDIDQYEVDLMYVNTLENFFMVDVAQQLNIPSVWNVHESEPWQTYFDRFGSEIACRALECFRYPYRLIFVADATRDGYSPLNTHHNFTVVHNGLDLQLLQKNAATWTRQKARESLGLSADEKMVLLLGTVCERKGQHDLIKALPYLAEKELNVKYFIVGDRPNLYSLQLANLVEQLPTELRQQVEIVPETPDTAKYYQAADIFLCTSRVESYPRVILEAMAYHLPIITTPVFGIVEQVKPNINGLFYTPDQPAELAEALVNLLNNPELLSKLTENSQYVLDSLHSFEDMTNAYAQVFQEAYFSVATTDQNKHDQNMENSPVLDVVGV